MLAGNLAPPLPPQYSKPSYAYDHVPTGNPCPILYALLRLFAKFSLAFYHECNALQYQILYKDSLRLCHVITLTYISWPDDFINCFVSHNV